MLSISWIGRVSIENIILKIETGRIVIYRMRRVKMFTAYHIERKFRRIATDKKNCRRYGWWVTINKLFH